MRKNENLIDFFGDIKQHLMTGVSYILPVIIIYAFFMVLGQIPGPLGEVCAIISTSAQRLIVPVLTAYIAFSIAGKLAFAPAFVVGLVTEQLGMGFIGGLIAGIILGYVVKALIVVSGKIKPGQANTILMSFIVVPIVATLFVGSLVYFVIAGPVIAGTDTLNIWLNNLSTSNAVLLAAILGAMIAFDMGGPINKVAYTFAIAASTEGLNHVVAPVLIAITIPVSFFTIRVNCSKLSSSICTSSIEAPFC
jgi:fructose-specific phosphotransferase system IIC component